jgi:cytidyltransferase-like protein
MKDVAVTGGFDNIGSRHLRFLQEASSLGPLTVLLWSDEALVLQTGKAPVFPLKERLYFLNAVRYVSRVIPVGPTLNFEVLPELEGFRPQAWVDEPNLGNEARQAFCREHGLEYHVLPPQQLEGFPEIATTNRGPSRKKVLVTGCYDWFHSGHVRFFEEVSTFGDLYVVVGHDANIRLLKGPGHPLIPQDERRYVAGSIRYVTKAVISSGEGWLDAEPEIQDLKPDIYAVNEEGDRGGKREYCEKQGIEYLVLKRVPALGLPARSSTELRGSDFRS